MTPGKNLQPSVPVLIIIGMFFVLPFLVSFYVLHILTMIGIWAMLILGLNLVGSMGYISICHGAFYGIGAYAASLLTLKAGTPFVLNLAAGTALAGIMGLLIGYPAFRVRGHYFAIATLAFGLIISLVLHNWGEITRGDRGLSDINGPIMDPMYNYYFILTVTMVVVLLTHKMLYSRFGRKLRAIRADENLAAQIGVNTFQTKMIAFVVSAGIAGLAGAIMAHYNNYIHPDLFSFANSFSMIMGMIVGGIGTTLGAILGGGVAMGLPEILRFTADARYVVLGIVLILVMLFLPQGIMGTFYEYQKTKRGA
jgi:branched-chain amino acid transport system permease protein